MSMPDPVTLRLTDENGNTLERELPGPGGMIRVVVGDDPTRHSGVWLIVAPPDSSDVYISAESVMGTLKWSLHQSGTWQFAWVTNKKAYQYANTKDRIIERWDQPAEIGKTGWTHGFTVRVRNKDLNALPDHTTIPGDTTWLPAPPEGHTTSVHVVIARPDQMEVTLRGLPPFAGLQLADGRVLLLVASIDPLSDKDDKVVDDAVTQVLTQVTDEKLDGAQGPRLFIACDNERGDRIVFDCAIPERRLDGTASTDASPS
jgi:hypothetical protein